MTDLHPTPSPGYPSPPQPHPPPPPQHLEQLRERPWQEVAQRLMAEGEAPQRRGARDGSFEAQLEMKVWGQCSAVQVEGRRGGEEEEEDGWRGGAC